MPQFQVDTLIKTLRKEKGLTQAELSEGICTKGSLSRIERGERRPDWYTFEKLMEKLGQNPHNYWYDIITAHEKKIIETKDTINRLIRDKQYVDAEKLIKLTENDANFVDGFNLQYLLRMKSSIAHYLYKDHELSFQLAHDSIRVTKPLFDEEKVGQYLMTHDEILSVNCMASEYFCMGNLSKSTDLFMNLKKAADKNFVDKDENAKPYTLLLYNISKNLGLLKRFDECIIFCDEGLTFCDKHREAYFPPMFLLNKACSLFSKGEKELGEKTLVRAYSYLHAQQRDDELAVIKKYVLDEYGVNLTLEIMAHTST